MSVVHSNPLRIVLEPPIAIAPHAVVVPVTVVEPPFPVTLHPFRMMLIEPRRMMLMPPIVVMPFVMVVPIAAMVGVRERWDSRQCGRYGRDRQCSSEFHFDTSLLEGCRCLRATE
jgi:hypothetical protein